MHRNADAPASWLEPKGTNGPASEYRQPSCQCDWPAEPGLSDETRAASHRPAVCELLSLGDNAISRHRASARARHAFLLKACDDAEVRAEVQTLLTHATKAEHFLESPVSAAAASALTAAIPSLSGTRVGVFEVGALVGAGGMGDEYRARDTRLNREVALKILPLTFAQNPARLDRFRREAQALASLNHPNIGAIYGFEETGGVYALVLELG